MSNVKTESTKVKRVVALLTQGQIGFLKEMQDCYQLPTLTSTVAYAIGVAYKQMKMDNVKLYGYGAESKRAPRAQANPDWDEPEPVAKKPSREEQEEANEKVKLETAIRIAEDVLKGVVIKDQDGNPKSVKWFQYESFNRTEQEDPILHAEALVESQYLPSREAVEATRERYAKAGKQLPYNPAETMADFLGLKIDKRRTKVVAQTEGVDWDPPA